MTALTDVNSSFTLKRKDFLGSFFVSHIERIGNDLLWFPYAARTSRKDIHTSWILPRHLPASLRALQESLQPIEVRLSPRQLNIPLKIPETANAASEFF